MLARLAFIVVAAALVGGCTDAVEPGAATPAAMTLAPCDDGGSGGVLIDGVCL